MPAGQPQYIATPEEFQRRADAYFEECDNTETPYTICGLAIALGFVSRQSLLDYANKPEFFDTVKASKLKVEASYELRMVTGRTAPASSIFGLKNFGWRDESHQTVNETRKVISSEPLSADEWAEKYGNE